MESVELARINLEIDLTNLVDLAKLGFEILKQFESLKNLRIFLSLVSKFLALMFYLRAILSNLSALVKGQAVWATGQMNLKMPA